MTALCTTLPDNLRLLLVDDHRIFLDGLSLALSPLSQNLQIHTAHSAAEAEQCLRSAGWRAARARRWRFSAPVTPR